MAPIPVFHATAVNGRLEFPEDTQRQVRQWIGSLNGQLVDVTIQPHRKQRSLDQNAWIWGVAYPLLAEVLGYDHDEIEDLHYGLIEKWAGTHWDQRMRTMVPNKRSSHLTTREFSDYMEWLVRFAAKGGTVIPLPDDVEAA